MDIVDARSGRLISVGRLVAVGSDTDDWYTITAVRFRSPLTRTAVIRRYNGQCQEVVMPVKLFPKLLYGPDFPSDSVVAAVYPS
jgi:hypothetical protein